MPLRSARLWAGVATFWLAVGALAALQQRLADVVIEGGAAPVGLVRNLLAAAAWIPFTMGAAWMALHAPVTRESWRWSVPIHLFTALVVALGVNLVMAVLFQLAGAADGAGLVQSAFEGAVQWAHVLVLVYALIVGVAHAADYGVRSRARETALAQTRAELAETRLAGLRSQLRPHFFFNALHTLGMLWRLGRGREAQETLERLSYLMRSVLEHEARDTVSLEEEVMLVESYLAVEQVRFGDRLSVDIGVPTQLRGLPVPPLVLQPLVENAIRHGLEGRSGAGCVRIRAEQDGVDLVLRVEDDGPGPGRGTSKPGAGVGLSNLRERLQHRYGSGAGVGLRIGDGVGAWGGAEGVVGTVAEVRIPGAAS